MEKKSEASEQTEQQVRMSEDNTSDDQPTKHNELNFPWPLINTIMDSKATFQSKSKFVKHLLFLFRLQLLVVFSICIVCIVVGSVFLGYCYNHRMLCIFFIVQGTCGIFVVIVHMCAIAFE